MALGGSIFTKKVTIPAATAVGVLSALTSTPGSYTVLVYDPQSEQLNLSLADAAGVPTDPEATVPGKDNPFRDQQHVLRRLRVQRRLSRRERAGHVLDSLDFVR